MKKKIIKILFIATIIQLVVYLFGFFNSVASQTGNTPWVDVSTLWMNFSGIIYWSILSMISVVGFTLSIYMLASKKVQSNQAIGLIISAIGFGSPIIFSFFLIIPATLMILSLIFIKMLIIDDNQS